MPVPGIKPAAERILSLPPASWVGRRRTLGRRLVLAYHNVVPDGAPAAGDRGLHLPLSAFVRQMDHLKRSAHVVPLGALFESPEGAAGFRNGRPRVAVTFDDAYRGAVVLAVDALARRELPATVFVAPGLLGGSAFWWDRIRWPDDPATAARIRRHAMRELRGIRSKVVAWAGRRGPGVGSVPSTHLSATEGELLHAARRPGIALGSHGWSHASLPDLDPDSLERELVRPRAWLSERSARFLPWISYPYGRHSSAVRDRAAALYERGFGITGGWFAPRQTDRFAVPRLNVPANLSFDGFRARVAGFLADR